MGQSTFGRWLVRIFGSRNERLVKSYLQVARAAGPFEAAIQALSDEQLLAKTAEFKAALKGGRRPEEILTEAFAAFRGGTRAELLHVMDEAAAQYARGSTLLDTALHRVEKGEGKLGLQAEEIRPFRDLMARLGATDKEQRSLDLVREVLQTGMPQLLMYYYPGFPRLRPEDREKALTNPVQWAKQVIWEKAPHRLDLEDCARQAPGKECAIKMLRGSVNCRDLPVIRRAFVIPGDDPDKVLTSYQTVRPDKGDGVLVTIELRYRMLPYIYGVMEEASRTGLPAMRPLMLEFPAEEGLHGRSDEFMFGPSLLVAPVLWPDQTSREVALPAGQWYDYWADSAMLGGSRTIRVSAPLDRLPLFVRAGAMNVYSHAWRLGLGGPR